MPLSRQRRAAEAARAMPEDAGTLSEMVFVDQAKMLRLMSEDDGGDKRAERVARAAFRVVADTLMAAGTGQPKLCLCCPREITNHRFSAMVVVPLRHDLAEVVGAAICEDCAEPRDLILGRALAAFRNVWPDIRQLSIPPGMGP